MLDVESLGEDVSAEARKAVAKTIEVIRWAHELAVDDLVNKRGGTDENFDVPRPEPPQGDLVPYIVACLADTPTKQS